ncbi:MAG TPA: hypothetical protein PK054_02680 [Anaerohalosphaeraceae bacterium]|nr:hypothetical protein [Anaerohalosphaeraceae bacterium]
MAVTVTDPSYRVEVFATYSNPNLETVGFSMVFDDTGNLYIPHISGHIYKVSPDKTSTLFVANAGTIRDMVWAGGTAYGNVFFITDQTSNKVKKINTNGNITDFAFIWKTPVGMEIDRVGHYENRLYVGMNVYDRIDYVLPNGATGTFSYFPYDNNGGVEGLAFDPGLRYGGLMYAGIFSNSSTAYRGVYALDLYGYETEFSKNLAWAQQIEFDPGTNFGGFMFVMGGDVLGGERKLWKLDENGIAALFAQTTIWQLGAFCFGPDGAMYVSEFDYNGRINTISRITLIPEPASLFLFSVGLFLPILRKNHK